jgi:hypothetical protein
VPAGRHQQAVPRTFMVPDQEESDDGGVDEDAGGEAEGEHLITTSVDPTKAVKTLAMKRAAQVMTRVQEARIGALNSAIVSGKGRIFRVAGRCRATESRRNWVTTARSTPLGKRPQEAVRLLGVAGDGG